MRGRGMPEPMLSESYVQAVQLAVMLADAASRLTHVDSGLNHAMRNEAAWMLGRAKGLREDDNATE